MYDKIVSMSILCLILLNVTTTVPAKDFSNSTVGGKEHPLISSNNAKPPDYILKCVEDKKTHTKLYMILDSADTSNETYEWVGGTFAGYAHGQGIVRRYDSSNNLIGYYKGQFTKGKMQGLFTGRHYDDKLKGCDFEWYCLDGMLNGKLVLKRDDFYLEASMIYNRVESLKLKYKSLDAGIIEIETIGDKTTGKIVAATGDVYEGQLQDDKMNGKGILKWANGATYEGEFQNNKLQGKGTLRYTSGNVYKGDFSNNKRHGFGILYDKTGKIIKQGRWNNDELQEVMTVPAVLINM